MSGWNDFHDTLSRERQAMAHLAAAAQAVTTALVMGAADDIERADRMLEARRVLHEDARSARLALQRKGFGPRKLRDVCSYAPPALRPRLYAMQRDMDARRMSLEITIDNNRALILSGLERLQKIAAVLHDAGTEATGTYRRRGTVPPAHGSVLVSRRA